MLLIFACGPFSSYLRWAEFRWKLGFFSSSGPDNQTAGYSLSSCSQDGMHLTVFALFLSGFVCLSAVCSHLPLAGAAQQVQ